MGIPLSGEKWAILFYSHQQEDYLVCCRPPSLLLLPVLYLSLQDTALRCGVKKWQCSSKMCWKSAPVWEAAREAKQCRQAQAQLSLTRAKRMQTEPGWSCWAEGSWAELGREGKSSSARSSHMGWSPVSQAVVPHNLCYLALRGLSHSFFPCHGHGEPATRSGCHFILSYLILS